MPLSYTTRMKLGDNSSFLKRQEQSSVQKQISNAQGRLQSVGADYQEPGTGSNFLLKTLDIISRPGYAANNVVREFSNEYAGSTPGEFDPLQAFWRGIKGQDKAQGKDIFTDIGMEGEKGVFGGEAKWYNPSPAGAAGLALDMLNPLDPVNWVSFGVGDDIVKGSAKGANAIIDSFGATKGNLITDILKKTGSSLDDIGADTVGNLVPQILNKVDDANDLKQLTQLIQEGITETGKNATSKLNYKAMKPLQVGLQNPLSIGNSGMSVKLPGYKATGGKMKLPILYPGKDLPQTMINIPGSEYVTDIVGSIAKRVGSIPLGTSSTVGGTLGKMFSTAFVPNTVPSAVIKKDITTSNLGELVELSRTTPDNVPLSIEELMALNDELGKVTLNETFDFADNMSVTDMKKINKGQYLSVENLARKVGLRGFTTPEVTDLLTNTPFNKTITELYDELRVLKPEGNAKGLFTNAVQLRKVMDLMYDQIPEGLKPYFTGAIKSQMSDLYPTDLTTHRLGKNVASSPLMAYEFNYKGVPVSVVVNTGEDFNQNAWARVAATIESLNELPETSIQALKGQIDISPIPIKVPDTSMTIGDTIVLGRIDKPTVAHEYGHIWDNVAGDKDAYSKAILNDAQKIDDTITPGDLYSDYSRSLYDTDMDLGIKEDLADSVSDYINDPKTFRELYPGRSSEIERMLQATSIPQSDLAKMVTEQRKLADSVANIPRTETQITKMVEDVDKFAYKMAWEPGNKTYQTFRGNLNALFEQTNWKTRQWQEQVGTIFKDLDEEARKQIMDAAAQITGTGIPKNVKAEPQFAQQDFPIFMSKLEEVTDKMPNRMPVEDFKNYLNSKQVKKEELKWTFMDDLLDGKTHVTKQEVQQWVQGNKLDVQEVWRGGNVGPNNVQNNFKDTWWINDERMKASELDSFIQDGTLTDDEEAVWDTLLFWGFGEEEASSILSDLNNIPISQDGMIPTKFSQYTQPGGEDYTELIFTLPDDYDMPKGRLLNEEDLAKLEERKSRLEIFRDQASSAEDYDEINNELMDIEGQLRGKPATSNNSFTYEPHWGDTKNPVAHTRFDTRYTEDGRKVLFIDEIQSDWHQQGRDRGYKSDFTQVTPEEMKALRREVNRAIEENDGFGFDDTFYARQALESEGYQSFIQRYDVLPETRDVLENYSRVWSSQGKVKNAVPDAPFKTNWDEYVQKRLLRYAADNGYDGIAWSTGKQQADRWGQQITEGIDTIQYNQESQWLRLYKDGHETVSKPVPKDQLAGMLGADVSRRLLDTTPDTFTIRPIEKNPSTGDMANRMPDDMDAVEMLRWIERQPEHQALRPIDGPEKPVSYQVVDQNGNAWGYVYHSEEAAQKAIRDLEIVGDTLKTVSGTNITVGGEGMRKFYDQQVPSNFKKLGKKFGLTIDEVDLDFSGVSEAQGVANNLDEADDVVRYYSDGDETGGMGSAEDFIDFNIEEGDFDMENSSPEDITEFVKGLFDYDGLFLDSANDVENMIKGAKKVLRRSNIEMSQLDIQEMREALTQRVRPAPEGFEWYDDSGEIGFVTRYSNKAVNWSKQQGIWLDPKSRQAIKQQSFPLYANQDASSPMDNLTDGWSDKQITALDNFLKWRNSVVKQYRQLGIPINELEKYVPFIPKRVLKKDEANVVRAVFGTGAENATGDNFDTLLTELAKMDPNLKQRTTKATRPAEVNKILKSEWLTEDAAVAMNIRGTRAIKAQEFNGFADEFVKEYGLHATDITKMTNGTTPEGYMAFKVGVDQDGNKIFQRAKDVVTTTMNDTEIIFLPEEMVNLYHEYMDLMFDKKKQNGLLQVYDSMSRLYKKAAYLWNPGHVFRDFQGNVYNNYLMGVMDPAEYAEGLRVLRGAKGNLDTPNGPIPYADIYDKAQRMGIIDSVMEHELPTLTGKAESGYSKVMRKATYATDGWTRTTGFIHNLKQGQSFEQAAATTKKFLFDYFDLTPFERKVMKRVIPFYTWMRKNIPLQLEVLVKNPRVFARINDIQNAIAGEVINWDEKPEYVQDNVAIKGKNSRMYTSMNLPYQDVAKIPTTSNAAGDLLSSVNPLIRVPIESITNRKWWTGQDLEQYSGEQTDIPVLTTLLETLGMNKGPQVGARYAGNVINNMPIVTRAGNLLDTVSGKETNDVRNLSRVSSTMGGPSVYDASSVENSADWQERQRLIDLIQRLKDEGYNIPTSGEAKSEGRYRKLSRLLGR